MQLLISIVLMGYLGFNPFFTNCVIIEGQLNSPDGNAVSAGQMILVYQGKNLLCDSTTHPKGIFTLDICLSGGEPRNKEGEINTVDFYTITEEKDTLLMASVEGFSSDGALTGDMFTPKKTGANEIQCPKCMKSDKLYSLVYSSKQQRDFTVHAAKFYCTRDRVKF